MQTVQDLMLSSSRTVYSIGSLTMLRPIMQNEWRLCVYDGNDRRTTHRSRAPSFLIPTLYRFRKAVKDAYADMHPSCNPRQVLLPFCVSKGKLRPDVARAGPCTLYRLEEQRCIL